jgi:uncharacterized protein YecT (DUF1311 family)
MKRPSHGQIAWLTGALGAAFLIACASAGASPECPKIEPQVPAAPAGQAPASSEVGSCDSGGTTLEIKSCLAQELGGLQSELQQALTELDQKLRSRNTPEAAAALATSQAQWEMFRDSQCDLPQLISGVGSLGGIDATKCRRDLTAQRLKQVRALREGIME